MAVEEEETQAVWVIDAEAMVEARLQGKEVGERVVEEMGGAVFVAVHGCCAMGWVRVWRDGEKVVGMRGGRDGGVVVEELGVDGWDGVIRKVMEWEGGVKRGWRRWLRRFGVCVDGEDDWVKYSGVGLGEVFWERSVLVDPVGEVRGVLMAERGKKEEVVGSKLTPSPSSGDVVVEKWWFVNQSAKQVGGVSVLHAASFFSMSRSVVEVVLCGEQVVGKEEVGKWVDVVWGEEEWSIFDCALSHAPCPLTLKATIWAWKRYHCGSGSGGEMGRLLRRALERAQERKSEGGGGEEGDGDVGDDGTRCSRDCGEIPQWYAVWLWEKRKEGEKDGEGWEEIALRECGKVIEAEEREGLV